MGIKTFNETHMLGDELSAEMEVGNIDGEHLDTRVRIDGEFWVSGGSQKEFAQKLESLITEYRI